MSLRIRSTSILWLIGFTRKDGKILQVILIQVWTIWLGKLIWWTHPWYIKPWRKRLTGTELKLLGSGLQEEGLYYEGDKGLFWDCRIGQNLLGFSYYYVGIWTPFTSPFDTLNSTKLVSSFLGIWRFLYWDLDPPLPPSIIITSHTSLTRTFWTKNTKTKIDWYSC